MIIRPEVKQLFYMIVLTLQYNGGNWEMVKFEKNSGNDL